MADLLEHRHQMKVVLVHTTRLDEVERRIDKVDSGLLLIHRDPPSRGVDESPPAGPANPFDQQFARVGHSRESQDVEYDSLNSGFVDD